MSTETTQPLPADSLDDQLDSLLRLSASEEPATIATPVVSASQVAADAIAVVDSVENQLNELMANELATDSATLPPESASPPAATAPSSIAPATHTTSSAVPDSVEDLDTQLAHLTESLLAENTAAQADDAAKRAAAATITAENQARAPLNPLTTPTPTPTPIQASPSSPHAAGAISATQSSPAAAPPAHPTPAPAAHATSARTEPAKPVAPGTPAKTTAVEATKVKAALRSAAQVGESVTPLTVRVLTLLNKPLEGKPAIVRDSLGWVAASTLFNAVAVWVFVGFFQKPPDLSIPRNAPQIKSDAPADETSHDPAATAEKPAGHANTDDASKATHGNDNATNRGGH